ncbi:MAG TPA: tetratricopeptide repeat protein [Candidatus Angelobacter sp.]|nr:tetratricopeptide repeat protein [Candidatus Angelobacter sp.]
MKTHFSPLRRWLSLALLVCGLLSVGRADTPQWIEIKSPHFSVATDAGEKRGREAAMRFEQMRGVFGSLMSKANVNLSVPLQIVAFRNTKELRQFAPLFNGKPIELAGLFMGSEDRSFIMLDMSVENSWSVVFHEYAHQLLNGNLATPTDPWFDEGFAEYFSTIEIVGKEAHVGKPPSSTYLILSQNRLIKIADLLKVQHNSAIYNESGDHRSVFYAESSMLVHYLYDNKLIPKLTAYFNLKNQKGLSVEEALQQSLGMSPAQLDKILETYINRGESKYYALQAPGNLASGDLAISPLRELDSNAILADIHLHSRDYQDKAIAEFQDILKADPNNAASCVGLGYAYLRKTQMDEAGKYFQRATELDTKDARAYYYSAFVASSQGNFADHTSLPETLKKLERAIQLDPAFADSYRLLAFAQQSGGNPAQALETIKKALSLRPRDENYQFDLAQIYVANEKTDEAMPILHILEKSQNPQVVLRVQSIEHLIELNKERKQQFAALESRSQEESNSNGEAGAPKSSEPPAGTPIKFMHGVITEVDCTSAPAAMLSVTSGTKKWKMRVPDLNRAVIFGADTFSCSWTNQKVSLNYRQTADGEGSVVSIETQ